jgi:hypothetical protein
MYVFILLFFFFDDLQELFVLLCVLVLGFDRVLVCVRSIGDWGRTLAVPLAHRDLQKKARVLHDA